MKIDFFFIYVSDGSLTGLMCCHTYHIQLIQPIRSIHLPKEHLFPYCAALSYSFYQRQAFLWCSVCTPELISLLVSLILESMHQSTRQRPLSSMIHSNKRGRRISWAVRHVSGYHRWVSPTYHPLRAGDYFLFSWGQTATAVELTALASTSTIIKQL